MIVPEYWAEARLQQRVHREQFTVRRFGWSDDSSEAAQRHADERARKALQRLLDGENVLRREPKVPYNGAEGVPIREQIVERHGDTIITRNSYGARCLNTPDVLFADVDFRPQASFRQIVVAFVLLLGAAVAARFVIPTGNMALLGLIVAAFVFAQPAAALAHRVLTRVRGGHAALARRRIRRFAASHPDWQLRVYRTPAGYRVMAVHKVFEPRSDEVARCFEELAVDPIYARMCKVQNCFRARVSPKPWRMGIGHHMKPRPGVWPVNPERMAERQRWIDAYELEAPRYAACRFVERLGSTLTDARAEAVRKHHDRMCRSDSDDPIA